MKAALESSFVVPRVDLARLPGLVALRVELIWFAAVLLLVNSPLVSRSVFEALIFTPAAMTNGEWWRLFTHPFVHVSWYHLLLDGSAFLMLYAELGRWSSRGRGAALLASGGGSLVAAMASSNVAVTGFCGLSGVAHGLMAMVAVEMIGRSDLWQRRLGWLAFGTVGAKAMLEAMTGEVVFSMLHFDLMGSPIAACHAGGVIGGLVIALLRRRLRACHGNEMKLIRLHHEPRPALLPCPRSRRVGSFTVRGRAPACVHRDRRWRRSR